MAKLDQYLWMAVVGTFFGFFYAFGIGANDVANAFASTVASKSLTLKQAVVVAGIFEFCGAYFLGASVTSTIRSKIFDTDLYENHPEIVMLGMMTSLIVATFMLLTATAFGLPVSTTHTVVGAIMGFSIAAKGFDSINWDQARDIFLSWVISPLVSGAVSFVFFMFIRTFVMRNENAFHRAYLTFPLVLFVGVGIDLFYVLYKGLNNTSWDPQLKVVLPASFATGAVIGIIWLILVGPLVKKRILAKMAREDEARLALTHAAPGVDMEETSPQPTGPNSVDKDSMLDADEEIPIVHEGTDDAVEVTGVTFASPPPKLSMHRNMGRRFANATFSQDLKAQSLHENAHAAQLWEDAEQFDPHAEELFSYIQVFTACLNSFAHGANDVANAIAPISAVVYIYRNGELSNESPVQKWILAYGGVGLVLGLLLYGYKVMKSVGWKVTPLSPSRGACAELAASLFVVTASFKSIPVSSTQCIVGAVAGVGLTGGVQNVHWMFLGRVCVGWVVVFFTAAILNAGLFSFCAFSPGLTTPVA